MISGQLINKGEHDFIKYVSVSTLWTILLFYLCVLLCAWNISLLLEVDKINKIVRYQYCINLFYCESYIIIILFWFCSFHKYSLSDMWAVHVHVFHSTSLVKFLLLMLMGSYKMVRGITSFTWMHNHHYEDISSHPMHLFMHLFIYHLIPI